jgi:hypothetical protein
LEEYGHPAEALLLQEWPLPLREECHLVAKWAMAFLYLEEECPLEGKWAVALLPLREERFAVALLP